MTLKQQVTELLNDEANSEIVSGAFFQSEWKETTSDWWDEWGNDEQFRAKLQELQITTKHLDNFGGEGEGDDYWSVYSFSTPTETVMVKFQGWYASYQGSEYTEWFFVEPKQVMVTQYEKT